MDFDIHHPFWIAPEEAEKVVQNAWLAQCRSGSWTSTIISRATLGVHSHTAVLRRNNGTADVLEMLQFRGGRAVPFCHLSCRKGIIDIFSPCRDGIYADKFDAKGCVEVMRELTQYDYGWAGLFRMVLRAIPGVWRLIPLETSDIYRNDGPSRPFCSHAAALAYQIGGGVDPVPRLPPYYVTPNHLTWSMFFDYEFSLATPWAIRKGYVEDPVHTVADWLALRRQLSRE